MTVLIQTPPTPGTPTPGAVHLEDRDGERYRYSIGPERQLTVVHTRAGWHTVAQVFAADDWLGVSGDAWRRELPT